jgi:Protein of unknown function (DUF559)
MARDLDGTIAERSRSMLGLVTIPDLDAVGVSRQQRRTLVARGVLVPLGGGVFRHAAHPMSWHQTALAAVLAAGAGALASLATAGALWRFDRIVPPPDPDVLVGFGRHPRAGPGHIHRTRDLTVADADRVGLIPVTTPARTICDLAAALPADRLEAVLDHAEQRNQLWRPHLRWRLDALRRCGRSGLPALAALLDRTDGRPLGDSWLEQEAIRVIVHAGLPVPRAQVKLRRRAAIDGARPTIARVDLFWDDARLVAEIAGQGTHAVRRDRQRDAERGSDLALARWRVVTFVYEDVVERPDYVVDTIRSHLALAA